MGTSFVLMQSKLIERRLILNSFMILSGPTTERYNMAAKCHWPTTGRANVEDVRPPIGQRSVPCVPNAYVLS